MTNIYMDNTKDIEERLTDLIKRMTISEKIGQLTLVPATEGNEDEIRELVRSGRVGNRILASTCLAGNEQQSISNNNENNIIQRIAMTESRLHIPVMNGRDIIHGCQTIYPIPLATAASWDEGLVKQAAKMSAEEALETGVHWVFSPALDIARDHRWGRVAEGYGEDPYLCSRMARAMVEGIQGEDLTQKGSLAACAKHYIGYGAAEGGRDYNLVELSEYTLRNVYLPPFKAAVDAGVVSIMSAFHELGGIPITGNKKLITDLLKTELDFNGFVVCDWNAVEQLQYQRVVNDSKEATRLAIASGIDMDMISNNYMNYLQELINDGTISEDRIDDAVKRVLRVKFKLGLFDKPYIDETHSSKKSKKKHRILARKLASKSIVLLENNDKILPLSKDKIHSIAVLGPFADEKQSLLGTWSADGIEKDVVSILDGIKEYECDYQIYTAPMHLNDVALQMAKYADVIILALGESNSISGEARSIAELTLPVGQVELLRALKRLNKPVITIINAGRPLVLTEVKEYSDALIYAWHGGVEHGNAVADILFGKEKPSGKLPITFLRAAGQTPYYYNHMNNGRRTDEYYQKAQFPNYEDIIGTPLYPFGYGLSYTEFIYSDLSAEVMNGSLSVKVKVKNIGDSDGLETVQCYIQDEVASVTRPLRELKDYKQIKINAGKEVQVEFLLNKDSLSFYNSLGEWCFEPGVFIIYVGGNSIDCIYCKVIVE